MHSKVRGSREGHTLYIVLRYCGSELTGSGGGRKDCTSDASNLWIPVPICVRQLCPTLLALPLKLRGSGCSRVLCRFILYLVLRLVACLITSHPTADMASSLLFQFSRFEHAARNTPPGLINAFVIPCPWSPMKPRGPGFVTGLSADLC